jgi:hypothetical protein
VSPRPCQADAGVLAMTISYRKQDVADVLLRCGHPELADEALLHLPDPVDIDQVQALLRGQGMNLAGAD